MAAIKVFLICLCIVLYNIEVLSNIQRYKWVSINIPEIQQYHYIHISNINKNCILQNMCFNFYSNLEYLIAHQYKTWHHKWDRSLRCLLWILRKSTNGNWWIAGCNSSKCNQWETRIGGFSRTGLGSKINIILVS